MAVNPAMVIRIAANLAELKRNLAEGKNQIETTTAAMSKLASSLSGDKLIQNAHNIVAAVTQIGGASKLTEAEKARLNATLDKALAKYQALGKEAPAAMVQLAEATKQVVPPLSMADRAAGLLKSTFGQFTAASLVSAGLQKVIAGVSEFVATGAKLPAMEASFKRLTTSMGQDGRTMLENIRSATLGLVSNYDMMAAANKAMLLGLPVTSESMGELAKTATVLGRAMGQDATKSLEDLITALGRSSPMILDNLGLTVKVGEANERYAQKMGIVGRELTDAEKKIAFYEAAMESARAKTVELGDQTRTLGEIATSTWVTVGNFISRHAGEANVAIGQMIASYRDWRDVLADLVRYGVPGGFAVHMPRDPGRLPKAPPKADVHLPDPRAAATEEAAERARRAAAEAQKAAAAWAQSVRELARDLSGAQLQGEVRRLHQAVAVLNAEQLRQPDVWKRVGEQVEALRVKGAALTPELVRLGVASGEYGRQVRTVSAGLPDAARGLFTLKTEVRDLTPAVKEIRAGLPQGFGIMFNVPKPTIDSLRQTRDVVGDLKAHVKGAAVAFGYDAADIIAQGIRTGNWSDVAKQMKTAVANFMGEGIAAGVNALVPGLGTMLQPIFSAISEKFLGLFDRNKGRDLVKEFAASLGGFDALHKQLNALGAEGERLWIRLTQGVGRNNPDQARAAIEAVNQALGRQNAELEKQSARLANAAAVMEEYGFTFEDAGAKWRAANLGAQLDALFEKTLTLRDVGIDYDEILRRQAGQYSALLQRALATNTEIDVAMKPVLQRLVDMGLLVDANGQAFESLEDVSWAKTLTQGFDQVTAAINRLTETLTSGLGGALTGLTSRKWTIPIDYGIDALPEPGSRGPVFAAEGYHGWVNQPTMFVAGERGRERVDISPTPTPSRASGPMVINVTAPDGRALWSWMLDQAAVQGLS